MGKYAFITTHYAPHIGGVETHVESIHKQLRAMGYQGDVIVLGTKPSEVQDNATWIGTGRLLKIWGRGGVWRASLNLARALRRGNYAIWHFHDYSCFDAFMSMPIRLLNPAHMFMTFHGWEGRCPPDTRVVATRRKIVGAMDGTIAAGEFIVKWYGTPVDIVTYGGVDVNRFRKSELQISELPLRAIYVGGLRQDTGIMQMVEALAIAKKQYGTNIPLSIYGEGPMEQALTDFASQHKLEIKLSAPVRDVQPLIERSPIVFCSGYLTILEALCSSRIVFGYYHNAIREDYLRMHPAADSLFICGTKEEMAEKLVACISNLEQAQEKARKGWSWAGEQTWEALALKYLTLWGWSRS